MSDESLRELFRELHDEPISADSLARVRAGVFRGIAARRKRVFAFLTLVPVTIAILLFFAPVPRRAPVLTPPRPVIAPAILDQPREQEPVRPRMKSVTRRVKKDPEKPVLIRIETDDPEVVILLVGN
ncbi:MAG TPA: hypothetical protein VKB79_27630 [Bryobacteraceae bacterium]|nr:hypothetical protein [Bryobacteraceae bacterium]